jgi:mannan endo-1,4-beta-mannosidase
MSENGPLPDPDLMKRDGAWWSWFITWSGYIEDESKTTDEVKKRVFNSPLVITLDELPDLKNFPLKD